MRSTAFSCVTFYLVPTILIGLSDEVPLDGKKVRDAKLNEFPFVVSLEWKGSKENFCAGTLISRQSVLTAAHCLVGMTYDEFEIMVGSPDLRQGRRYQVRSWKSYEQWMHNVDEVQLLVNDIAVITLTEKVKECIPPPVLIFESIDLEFLSVKIAGWGASKDGVHPTILKTAVLVVISNDVCQWKVETLLQKPSKPFYVPENYFCSLGYPWVLGGCGDSGAPILNQRNEVVGIHRGVCPERISLNNYSKEFVNENLFNIHMRLNLYRNFIENVKI